MLTAHQRSGAPRRGGNQKRCRSEVAGQPPLAQPSTQHASQLARIAPAQDADDKSLLGATMCNLLIVAELQRVRSGLFCQRINICAARQLRPVDWRAGGC
jgi:hypothetical protein